MSRAPRAAPPEEFEESTVYNAATRSPRLRRLAAGSLVALAALGVSGCSALSPMATQMQYDASDGVSGGAEGFVGLRNAAFVGDGTSGDMRLIGTMINYDTQDHDYTLSVPGGKGDVQLKAAQSKTLEKPENKVVINRDGIGTGENVPVQISSDGRTETIEIPLLSGTLPEYRDYLPDGVNPSEKELTGHLTPSPAPEGGAEH